MKTIDNFHDFFSEESLYITYCDYVESKTDLFDPTKIGVPSGADGVTWQDFERNLESNLSNISRRVLNGSYYFYPLLEFEKEKPDGGVRCLSIACIRDALVQRQLYKALYESAEGIFGTIYPDVSFAYRKKRSAPLAASHIWRSFKYAGFFWAFDADITKFFDSIDHNHLMELVDRWIGKDSLPGKLIWRYIRTGKVSRKSYSNREWEKFLHHGSKRQTENRRLQGVPQGGVLSGMLANLYLHEFDQWVDIELKSSVDLRYYRYADDFVILTKSKAEAEALYGPVDEKLHTIGLSLNPDKTEPAVQIANGELEFVGFQFFYEKISARPKTVKRFKDRFEKLVNDKIERNTDTQKGILEEHRIFVRYYMNRKIRGPKIEICTYCKLPQDRHRNWMSYFSSTITDIHQIKELDRWMRAKVSKAFHKKYAHTKPELRIRRKHWRFAHAVTLESEYYRQRRFQKRFRGQLCQCNPANDQETEANTDEKDVTNSVT